MLTINTNMGSLMAQNNLEKSQSALQTSMQRLSSGLRINSAKDDAAGLAISDRMTSQINGLNQAVRNANDGISMAQTAEGALQESTNILQRMRELAVQGASDTNTTSDRNSINTEMTQLKAELTRIKTTTSFNNKTLLDGSLSVKIQVGANQGQTISFNVKASTGKSLGAAGLSVQGISVGSAGAASTAIKAIDTAISRIDNVRSNLGAIQNRLTSTIANLENVSQNITSARSRILDANIAQESANMTQNNILQQTGVAILAQANQTPSLALKLLQ